MSAVRLRLPPLESGDLGVGRAPPARSVTTDRPIMVRGIYITANDKVMEQAGRTAQ